MAFGVVTVIAIGLRHSSMNASFEEKNIFIGTIAYREFKFHSS